MPEETRHPCGCIVGKHLCPEAERLTEMILDCYPAMSVADEEQQKKVYQQYKERKAALGQHFKEGEEAA